MSNLKRLGIQDAHLFKDVIRETLTIRDKEKSATKQVTKRNSLKSNQDARTETLLAGIYWKKNDRAKRFLMNYYKGDPAGFMEDMRIYADRGWELQEIMNDIKTLEGG